ncbi:MAG: mechanosensitive ion channel protein [Pseudanabaena sp.]|nr:MAG: mechanosensitive ion channel protein [Pseudanabaena sp.]
MNFRFRFRRLIAIAMAVAIFLIAIAASPVLPQPSKPLAPDVSSESYPVVLEGKTLFSIQTGIEAGGYSFSPAERAKVISRKIEEVAQDNSIPIDAISIEDKTETVKISANKDRVMIIGEADAKAAGKTEQALAIEISQKIKAAIEQYRKSRDWTNRLIGIAYTAIATTALFLLLKFAPVFSFFHTKLNAWRERVMATSREQNQEFPWGEIANIVFVLYKVARFVAMCFIAYAYLVLVFHFFPETNVLESSLKNLFIKIFGNAWIAFIAYLPNALIIFLSISFVYYLLHLLEEIFAALGRRSLFLTGFYPEWAAPTYSLMRFLIIALTAVAIFPFFPGYGSPAFQGVSLFAGVIVSLGSASTVNNVISGIILIYTRGSQVGDMIKIGETLGIVLEQTLLVMRIRTIKNVIVTIPNSNVLGTHIINFSTPARDGELSEKPLILHTTVTLGYDIPWRHIHSTLIAAANATTHILSDPAPFVWQTNLNDFYVSYELNAFTDQPTLMPDIYAQLHENIQDKCNEAGIEILSPHFSAVRDGNQSGMPADYLPKDYVPPSFRISPFGNWGNSQDGNNPPTPPSSDR